MADEWTQADAEQTLVLSQPDQQQRPEPTQVQTNPAMATRWQTEAGSSFRSASNQPYQRLQNRQNPLLAAAQPLLDEVVHIQTDNLDSSAAAYRQQWVSLLVQFTQAAGQAGVNQEQLLYASYVLCTLVDEMINKSDWFAREQWNQQSLLAQYHGETGGGEKFFALLDYLLLYPAKQLLILELLYVCLSVGFEGKYHLLVRGYAEREQIQENLFQTIRLQRGEPEAQLADHCRAEIVKANALMRYTPVWVFVAATVAVIMAMYGGFQHFNNEATEQRLERIEQSRVMLPHSVSVLSHSAVFADDGRVNPVSIL